MSAAIPAQFVTPRNRLVIGRADWIPTARSPYFRASSSAFEGETHGLDGNAGEYPIEGGEAE